MQLLKSLGRGFAGTALLFSVVVAVGTSLVLLVSSCVGYLPYSDRPGPGWWGRVHWPYWGEFVTYVGFTPWFAYFCLFFGLGLFALSLVLGIASTPRWLNRLLGGVIAALAAGLAVLAGGWYFALAEIGPDAALILGLLYGVFLFPHFIQPRRKPFSMWIRVPVVTCAAAVFLYWIVSPLLPRRPIPNVRYELMRVTAGDDAVVAASDEGMGISNELAALKLHGQTHGGIRGLGGSSEGSAIDVELIALEPISKVAKLAIPKAGYVVYVLRDGVWTAHPSIIEKDKRILTIEPGIDARYDGGRVKLGKEAKFNAFTWYPTIPRGR